MDKYPQLTVFPGMPGEKVWRSDVYNGPQGTLTHDERQLGPRYDLPNGIYIVTVSEGTPTERFEIATLLDQAYAEERTTQGPSFVPITNYDSAVAVVNGRVVGGIVAADVVKAFFVNVRVQLSARGTYEEAGIKGHWRMGVNDLWVHRAHQRKGLARQLLAAMADHLGCSVGELCFRLPINKAAVRVLWSLGLRQVEGRY